MSADDVTDEDLDRERREATRLHAERSPEERRRARAKFAASMTASVFSSARRRR